MYLIRVQLAQRQGGPQGFEHFVEIHDEIAVLRRWKIPMRLVAMLFRHITVAEDGLQLSEILGGWCMTASLWNIGKVSAESLES